LKIDRYEFPDDLYYDREHNWARVEDHLMTQGMSDLGQALAGEIVFVEMPRVGRVVRQGEPFMSLESGKWVGRIRAMASGKIVAANEEIEGECSLINQSPYDKGWLAQIELTDPAELTSLMRPDAAFAEFIAAERKKYGK